MKFKEYRVVVGDNDYDLQDFLNQANVLGYLAKPIRPTTKLTAEDFARNGISFFHLHEDGEVTPYRFDEGAAFFGGSLRGEIIRISEFLDLVPSQVKPEVRPILKPSFIMDHCWPVIKNGEATFYEKPTCVQVMKDGRRFYHFQTNCVRDEEWFRQKFIDNEAYALEELDNV